MLYSALKTRASFISAFAESEALAVAPRIDVAEEPAVVPTARVAEPADVTAVVLAVRVLHQSVQEVNNLRSPR